MRRRAGPLRVEESFASRQIEVHSPPLSSCPSWLLLLMPTRHPREGGDP